MASGLRNLQGTDTRRVLLSDTWAGGGVGTVTQLVATGLRERGWGVDRFTWSKSFSDTSSHLFDRSWAATSLYTAVKNRRYSALHLTTGDLRAPCNALLHLRRAGWTGSLVVTKHDATVEDIIIDCGGVLTIVSSDLWSMTTSDLRTVCIPNGVPRASISMQAVRFDESPIVLWVGRGRDPVKDLLGLVSSLRHLAEDGMRVRIVDPDERQDLVALVRRWLGSGVELYGGLTAKELLALYRESAVTSGFLLSTSHREACPLVLLEAAAAGCPSLAPDVPGYRHFSEMGLCQLYDPVNLRDGVLAMVRRARDPAWIAGWRESVARAFDAGYSMEQMVASYVSLYEDSSAHFSSSDLGVLAKARWRMRYSKFGGFGARLARVVDGSNGDTRPARAST